MKAPTSADVKDADTPRPIKRRRSRRRSRRRGRGWQVWVRTGVEAAALLAAALVGVITVLGYFVEWFGGAGSWSHLLSFAAVVLALGLLIAVALRLWVAARRWLGRYATLFPAALALAVAGAAGWFASRPTFTREVGNLRTLVGGGTEAERVAIGHQVYAAYRRTDLDQVLRVLERARVYEPTVREASAAFGVDAEVLMGIAAAESAFYPRDSSDGGRGLFQITAPPPIATKQARQRLGVQRLDPLNQRHNAFVGAATLRYYMAEMRGDLFLGLLAYNIGPRNGGLRSIMRQYGARDFITIQPYLQHLPRDYPIRVLCAALAYRLWRTEGHLPRYEEGDNALRVQRVGIPGLQEMPPPLVRERSP
jgi:hypothetical protein